MSDPREFNFTSSNKGTQVNIDSYWVKAITVESCTANVKTPIDLTNITITGTILKSDGTFLVSLAEVGDNETTGFYVSDAVNGQFQLVIEATTSGVLTADNLGSYDIRFTDADSKTEVFLQGKIEFKLSASS